MQTLKRVRTKFPERFEVAIGVLEGSGEVVEIDNSGGQSNGFDGRLK
jgi:hypothetical protein